MVSLRKQVHNQTKSYIVNSTMQRMPIIPQQRPTEQTVQPLEFAHKTPPQMGGKKTKAKSTLVIGAILLSAVLFGLGITKFVFHSYQVDGPSMQATLQDEDYLIVVKTGKTWASITGNSFIPKRYEIVVFTKKGDVSSLSGNDKQLIKRVIGLPRERVVVKNGAITVYNNQFPNGFNPDVGQDYAKTINTTTGDVDFTIPDDEIFVAGDNRSNSLDSRAFGTVHSDELIGTLELRIFPLSAVRSF